jgi:NAD(P)-dependent dehydrogenase (short-subunit alcohol dehydrogenase family)
VSTAGASVRDGAESVPSPFRLDGRVAVVTGASSGLGMRFAAVLHGAGARVVAVARRADRLSELEARLPGLDPVPFDLSEVARLDELVEGVLERHGRVDVLVNNAGVTDDRRALEQDDAGFLEVLQLNLVVPHLLSTRFARAIVARGGEGAIVNVASILGLRGSGQLSGAGYAASKGGLVNLTRELAGQWARQGIRVNALAPGWFESELTSDMFKDERSLAFLRRRTPMGRVGRPEELDGALLFLATGASSFVTGQVVTVDGGWCAV